MATWDGRYHFITTLKAPTKYGFTVGVDGEGRRFPVHTEIPVGSSFLFDVRTDPDMNRNLAAEKPEIVKNYLKLVNMWTDTIHKGKVIRRQVTPEEEEQLRALGYGAGD